MASLYERFAASAASFPDRPAVTEGSGGATLTYRELADRVGAIADQLRDAGLSPGDRVGLCLPKSNEAFAALFGVLQTGAAYVPVDASAPAERNAFIFDDCAVKAVIALDGDGGLEVQAREHAGAEPTPELAYILYTSGSTGDPKGVMLTHDNANSFVDWCSEVFEPTEQDRFSSHAPFHFDLSILDIHVAVKHGACVVLVDEALGKNARALGPVIAEQGITIWYSTPTVLRLLTEFGGLAELDLSALRWVLFAGEVFPVKHLRAIKELLPEPRYANLYGPTETNVCTWLEIPAEVPADRETPYPIGRVTSNDRGRVVDEDGADVAHGEEGELVIAGGTVMAGYWNLPERSAQAFFDAQDGTKWYRTGDLVKDLGDGVLDYIGRRDRMVKRRGYRVELGEIENGVYKHPAIAEAAAVALPDPESGVQVRVFVVACEGEEKPPSLLQLKLHCGKVLLPYMVPDSFEFLESLPKTSTDKIDYQTLIKRTTSS